MGAHAGRKHVRRAARELVKHPDDARLTDHEPVPIALVRDEARERGRVVVLPRVVSVGLGHRIAEAQIGLLVPRRWPPQSEHDVVVRPLRQILGERLGARVGHAHGREDERANDETAREQLGEEEVAGGPAVRLGRPYPLQRESDRFKVDSQMIAVQHGDRISTRNSRAWLEQAVARKGVAIALRGLAIEADPRRSRNGDRASGRLRKRQRETGSDLLVEDVEVGLRIASDLNFVAGIKLANVEGLVTPEHAYFETRARTRSR